MMNSLNTHVDYSELEKQRIVALYYNLKSNWDTASVSFQDRFDLAFEVAFEAKKNGLYPFRRLVDDFSDQQLSGLLSRKGSGYINLGSNDYLGFSAHPVVRQTVYDSISKHGIGAGSVPMLAGTYSSHVKLEKQLAEFTGFEDCLLFNSGYSANTGAVRSIVGPHDAIILDTYCHASTLDGINTPHVFYFSHNDIGSLDRALRKAVKHKNVLIAVEGIYSMDGDLGRLDQISLKAIEFGAMLFVDDAHGIGVMGKQGKGSIHCFGSRPKVDFISGSFGKALAGIGGFVCGSRQLIKYLEIMSRPFLFSSSIPPHIASAAIAELDLLQNKDPSLDRLWTNTAHLLNGLKDIGYNTGKTQSPIIPIIIKDELTVLTMSEKLKNKGILVNPIIYPVVNRKKSRLRLSATASLTEQEISYALEEFAKISLSAQIDI